MRSMLILGASVALIIGVATPAPAQSASSYALTFLKEVGCSLLPFQACDVLDSSNAINLLRANQVMFVNKYCGTGWVEGAKQLVEIGEALDNARCRQILQGIGAIR